MRDLIQFFNPFFNFILFNHPNISLVELSFFSSILLFVTVGELISQKPKTSFASTGYFLSIALFLAASYLVFCELTWWKSIINILASIIVFLFLSTHIISIFNLMFYGFYDFKVEGSTIKRSATIFVAIVTIFTMVFLELLRRKTF